MKAKNLLSIACFFCGIFLLFFILSAFNIAKPVSIITRHANADLRSLDLAHQVACVEPSGWEFFPDVLYTPTDFSGQNAPTGRTFEAGDLHSTQYGTYRLTLQFSEDQYYALTSDSINYAQRLFINGVEQLPVGTPATDRENTIPAAQTYACNFLPKDGLAEIIIQYSNFNHAEGGEAYPLFIGDPQLIRQFESISEINAIFAFSCMFTVAIFYFGMFLFLKRKRYFAAFSLCCFGIGIRGYMDALKITGMVPYSWHFGIVLEYLTLILILTSFMAYIVMIRPGLLHKFGNVIFFGMGGVYALIVLTTPSTFFTVLLPYYQGICSVYGIYVVCMLIRASRQTTLDNVMILTGGVLFIVGAVAETLLHGHSGSIRAVSVLQISMMAFIMANMIAMAVYYSHKEQELVSAQEAWRQNEELARIYKNLDYLKSDLLRNISHEMKTPLAVMSGYAQLVLSDVAGESGAKKPTIEALNIVSREAQRLSRLVDRLILVEETQTPELTTLDLSDIIERARGICELMCERRGNRLVIDIANPLPTVLANQDMLLQVLINLLTNSNRHTFGGEITIRALSAPEGDNITVSIIDTGEGIPPELLPNIFKREAIGGSTRGHGHGLPICREIITNFGGEISVRNSGPTGTEVCFTLHEDKSGRNLEVSRHEE